MVVSSTDGDSVRRSQEGRQHPQVQPQPRQAHPRHQTEHRDDEEPRQRPDAAQWRHHGDRRAREDKAVDRGSLDPVDEGKELRQLPGEVRQLRHAHEEGNLRVSQQPRFGVELL